jgi:hypothetical protein
MEACPHKYLYQRSRTKLLNNVVMWAKVGPESFRTCMAWLSCQSERAEAPSTCMSSLASTMPPAPVQWHITRRKSFEAE